MSAMFHPSKLPSESRIKGADVGFSDGSKANIAWRSSIKTMKQETAICVWTEFDGDYAHIKGYVCKPELSANGPDSVDYYHPLHSIKLHSQASKSYLFTSMYAMEIAVDCYARVNLRDAKKAVAALTPIEKKMGKMQSEEGCTRSYGQWLNRVARAIGAKKVFIRKAGAFQQYIEATGNDIIYHGDSMERKIADWANLQAIAV